MNNALDQIKKAWNEQPLQVIVVSGVIVTTTAKLLNALTEARNAKTWKKEVERRRMTSLR